MFSHYGIGEDGSVENSVRLYPCNIHLLKDVVITDKNLIKNNFKKIRNVRVQSTSRMVAKHLEKNNTTSDKDYVETFRCPSRQTTPIGPTTASCVMPTGSSSLSPGFKETSSPVSGIRKVMEPLITRMTF
jgi:hypothetical protein